MVRMSKLVLALAVALLPLLSDAGADSPWPFPTESGCSGTFLGTAQCIFDCIPDVLEVAGASTAFKNAEIHVTLECGGYVSPDLIGGEGAFATLFNLQCDEFHAGPNTTADCTARTSVAPQGVPAPVLKGRCTVLGDDRGSYSCTSRTFLQIPEI
jgi:hypothetical protein